MPTVSAESARLAQALERSGSMPCYNFYILNRQGVCQYYHDWTGHKSTGPGPPTPEDHKLMFGLIWTMKTFAAAMDPKGCDSGWKIGLILHSLCLCAHLWWRHRRGEGNNLRTCPSLRHVGSLSRLPALPPSAVPARLFIQHTQNIKGPGGRPVKDRRDEFLSIFPNKQVQIALYGDAVGPQGAGEGGDGLRGKASAEILLC